MSLQVSYAHLSAHGAMHAITTTTTKGTHDVIASLALLKNPLRLFGSSKLRLQANDVEPATKAAAEQQQQQQQQQQ